MSLIVKACVDPAVHLGLVMHWKMQRHTQNYLFVGSRFDQFFKTDKDMQHSRERQSKRGES